MLTSPSLSPQHVTGLYGGTFDPIHMGHLNLAHSLLDAGHLGQCVLVPARRQPLKRDHQITDDRHRLAMIQLAIAGDSRLAVSEFELARQELSYTVVTAAAFAEVYGDNLRLVIGMDSLQTLPFWYRADELVARYRFLIYRRPGVEPPDEGRLRDAFGEAGARRLLASIVDGKLSELSATEVRERLQTGKDVAELLTPGVREYIKANQLYSPPKETS